MKTVLIPAPGEMQLASLPVPVPQAGEVLLRIHYVGFCGSDLNSFLGRNPLVKYPVVPGHEIGATVQAVGSGVPEAFVEGVPCTVNPYTHCGTCAACRARRYNSCRSNQTFGVQRDGAMCAFKVVPWEKILLAPTLSPQALALVEPMSVGFHAVARGQVTDLDVVAVFGCGMVGIGAIVRAVLRGSRVIAIDVDDAKLEVVRQLGVAHTINAHSENVAERLQELTAENGPDVVIEAVGAPATYQMAVHAVAFTGRVVCIGYAANEIAFQTKLFVQKELDIRGSRNALPEDFRAVMEYFNKGDFPFDQVVSRIVPPEEALQSMRDWARDPAKVFRILVAF